MISADAQAFCAPSRNTRQQPTRLKAAATQSVLVVAHDREIAMAAVAGASLALRVREKYLQPESMTSTDPCVAVLTTSIARNDDGWPESLPCQLPPMVVETDYLSDDHYQGVLQQFPPGSQPIVHAVLDGRHGPLLSPAVRQQVSFLGLQPKIVPESRELNRDLSREVGSALQAILDISSPSCSCVSLDWPWHLSLLQANALPKSEAHADSYLILPTPSFSEMVLADYIYDYERLGGTDPLLCLTKEQILAGGDPSTTSGWGPRATYAAAAAYSALRGNRMDAIPSACIARSVAKCVSNDLQGYSSSESDKMIEHLLQQSRQLSVSEGRVILKNYREFGYK